MRIQVFVFSLPLICTKCDCFAKESESEESLVSSNFLALGVYLLSHVCLQKHLLHVPLMVVMGSPLDFPPL